MSTADLAQYKEGDRLAIEFVGTLVRGNRDGQFELETDDGRLRLVGHAIRGANSYRKLEPPIKNGDLFTTGDGKQLFVKVEGGYRLVLRGDGEAANSPAEVYELTPTGLTRVTVTPA